MKTTNWTKVLMIGSISLLVLALVLNLFAPLLWRQFGGGVMLTLPAIKVGG